MPYEPPNPDAPTMTPPEWPELPDAEDADALRKGIEALRVPILTAWRTTAVEARNKVLADRRLPILAGAGPLLKTAVLSYEERLAGVARDPDLSAEGREKATRAAREPLNTAIKTIAENGMSRSGDELLAEYPEPVFPPPGPDVLDLAGLVYDSFKSKSGLGFLAEALGYLRRAVDPATKPADAFRANGLLVHAYGPLVGRRATDPERFAEAYRALYGELHELVRLHLDGVLNTEAYRVAVDLVDRARGDFTYLLGMVREHDGWDVAFEAGAPAFSWTE